MTERLHRLAAIVRADFLIRLRRPSTAVIFILLSAVAYWWIPDPATGRALLQIGGRRALYNSAAIGMGTAAVCTLFIGLVGYYVISNALRRDILSRCGFVIASTTMRGSEYLFGKFVGNVVFLTVFTAGFMTTSMAMVLVRGEAPLQPLVFAAQYLLLVPPSIAFVSALAVLFECVPFLSGKFGDVVYFIVWTASMGAVASSSESGGIGRYFDLGGLGTVVMQLKAKHDTDSLSIGASVFDPSKGTFLYEGLSFAPEWVLPRIVAMMWPLALVALARLFFHRFDPARVRVASHEKARRSWLGRLNLLVKPMARDFVSLANRGGRGTLLASARADALMTIASFPLIVAAIAGFAIATLVSSAESFTRGVLPFAFAGLAIALADVASRDKRAGTSALVFAAPTLRTRFVAWKFASALWLSAIFLAVPFIRVALGRPALFAPLAAGVVFTAAIATSLGILSATPKTFMVAFLTFFYLVTNDRGLTPAFDFAGFYGTATPMVSVAYLAVALLSLAAAELFHRIELHRRW